MQSVRDLIIIGGGIATHSAAIYAARANMKPLIISGLEPDQLSTTTLVENYPGFPEGIQGPDLIQACKKQAQKFGAEYLEGIVVAVKKKGDSFIVTADKKEYTARALIICTGASPKKLNIPGEQRYWAKGVSTCATCDGALYKDKNVLVIGGGDSAMEESLFLSKFAHHITIIHRKDQFKASKIMQDRVFSLKKKISVQWNKTITEILGDENFATGVTLKDTVTGREEHLACDGIFLAIGHTPNTSFLKYLIHLDEKGYIITDKLSRTSTPGIYAAGDCQDHVFKQAVTSAGTGCQAALQAEKYIESLKATKHT